MMEQLGFTREELEERRSGLGASELPIVAGLNPYRSALDIWLLKTGRAEPEPMNERQELGHIIEPSIGVWYQRRSGASSIVKPPTLRHPAEDWLFATPDLFADFAHGPRRRAEIKLVGWRVKHRWFIGDELFVPDAEYAQTLIQGAVSGIEPCDVVVWLGLGPDEQRIIPVDWAPEVANDLIEAGRDFWFNHVLADIPPSIDASESWKRHVAQKWPENMQPFAVAPADATQWAEQLTLANARIDEANTLATEAETHLKDLIGERDGIESPGKWRATWKLDAKGRTSWKDVSMALSASADLIEKHTSEPSRRFTFKELGK